MNATHDHLSRMAAPLSAHPLSWAPVGGRRRSLWTRLLDALVTWQQRAVTRHSLANMDLRQLKDIGLTRADVEREVRKPFWCA